MNRSALPEIATQPQGQDLSFPSLERCCDAAVSISRIGARTRAAWLHRMCECVDLLSQEHIGVMALDVRVVAGRPGWQTLECAFAGTPNSRVERRLYDDAWEGLRSDDIAGAAGQRRLRPERFVGPRRAMASDEVWRASAYRRLRERHGLFDFARALLPYEGEDGPRVLVVQIDGFDPGWDPEPEPARSFAALSRHLVDSYRRAFVMPIRHRAELLDRLTEAQREVAPFLASEMTQDEIADTLSRSRCTVHDHTKKIYKRWGVRTRVELRDLWNLHGAGEDLSAE